MIRLLLILFKKLGTYQLEGIRSKIEYRRAQIFNFSILIECVILFVNSIRHFLRGSIGSSITVLITLFFLLFLYATPFLKRTTKYAILIITGLVVTFFFTHFIDRSKDIIQIYFAILVATGLFLSGKQFYLLYFTTIFIYYFTFFNLGYYKIYNPLGSLTFIGLTVMMRLFVMDAESNEKIIDQQVEKLKEVDNLKTKFFANISHEIRTPLTLILGSNENLEKIQGTKKFTESIKNNSNRLLELINQILELSKIQNDQRIITISQIDFNLLINSYINSFQNLSESKKIFFKYDIDSNIKSVYLDLDAFSKIITNLLGNAFKFSNAGDTVFLEAISIDKNYLMIQVKDTGKGISNEELPYIFNQYFHSNVGLEASSGIGLALVKELINSIGGEISVESKINVGSTFTVKLPITIEQLQKSKINFSKNDTISKTIITELKNDANNNLIIEIDEEQINEKKVLLLVEDNLELRSYIKDVVSNNYTVIEAIDGEDGIQKATEFIPDIIISDIMMPKIDGLELLQFVKKDIRTSHIPVIMLTAKDSETDKIKGLEHEADDYLTKPFNQTELLLRLKNRISARTKLQKQLETYTIKNLKNHELISSEDKFLQSIKTLIEKKLMEVEFGPDELAKEIGLSKSQLLRKIKALTNASTSVYMRNIRLEFAKEKLVNKTASISEIAYETGFSSPNYFSKCFKEYTNYSPKEFLDLNS